MVAYIRVRVWGWVSPSCLCQWSVLLQVGDFGCYFCLPLNSILAPSGSLSHGTLLHNHQCELLTTKTMELKFVFEVETVHVISHSCILMLDVCNALWFICPNFCESLQWWRVLKLLGLGFCCFSSIDWSLIQKFVYHWGIKKLQSSLIEGYVVLSPLTNDLNFDCFVI